MSERKEVTAYGDIAVSIVGMGTMGSRILSSCESRGLSGKVVGLDRDADNYEEIVTRSRVTLLCTKQDDGMKWLAEHGRDLNGQIVVSLMGFVNLATLAEVCGNQEVGLARMMTNTSLNRVVWTDDGNFSRVNIHQTRNALERFSERVKYVGSHKDEVILRETLRACHLGWLAQDMAFNIGALVNVGSNTEEAVSQIDETLRLILKQRVNGYSYEEIFKSVATKGGVTERCSNEVGNELRNLLEERLHRGYDYALDLEEQYSSRVNKKGLEA